MIQAKPTVYAGVHFRSRLEARWAVFLTARRVSWTYEPYQFRVHPQDWSYTPDFEVTIGGKKVLLEIKPTEVSDSYRSVLRTISLAVRSSWRLNIFLGIGDFYSSQPFLRDGYTGKKGLLSTLFPKPELAIKAASAYRFDLRPRPRRTHQRRRRK